MYGFLAFFFIILVAIIVSVILGARELGDTKNHDGYSDGLW